MPAAVHRLFARLFEQFQYFLFVPIGQIGISRKITGESELHLAVGQLVFHLLNLRWREALRKPREKGIVDGLEG